MAGECTFKLHDALSVRSYSWLDLNDNGINGGHLSQHTFGLNWYLNDNTRLQFNYLNIQRNVTAPAASGTVHGFGIQA